MTKYTEEEVIAAIIYELIKIRNLEEQKGIFMAGKIIMCKNEETK